MVKGRIVLVQFPFDDFSSSKVRPAVCLTEPIGPHRHVVLAFITSQVQQDMLETDYIIDLEDPDFKLTGLMVASTVRLHRLMTVTSTIIKRELGCLSELMLAEINQRITKLFNL